MAPVGLISRTISVKHSRCQATYSSRGMSSEWSGYPWLRAWYRVERHFPDCPEFRAPPPVELRRL